MHAMSLVPIEPSPEWRPIFHDDVSNQVVLYNPSSHVLNIRPSLPRRPHACPYCKQPLPDDFVHDDDGYRFDEEYDSALHSRSRNYFNILAIANQASSEPSSSVPPSRSASPSLMSSVPETPSEPAPESNVFPPDSMAEGYFNAFFKEEWKLGMGANGSVFLCQHVLVRLSVT